MPRQNANRPPSASELALLRQLDRDDVRLVLEHSQQGDGAAVHDVAAPSRTTVKMHTARSVVRRRWVEQTYHDDDVTRYKLSAEGRGHVRRSGHAAAA